MKIIKATDYGFRRIVRVVTNDTDSEVVHSDGSAHRGDPTTPEEIARVDAYVTEFGIQPQSWEWCSNCTYNWKVEEFTFTREELQVGLNKWENPVHDGQEVISTRDNTWDELYAEVDKRLGAHAEFGTSPRKAPPSLVDEIEPDFELVLAGEPYMENNDGMAKQRFNVLRKGISKGTFIAQGQDNIAFSIDKATKFAKEQEQILTEEQEQIDVLVIVTG